MSDNNVNSELYESLQRSFNDLIFVLKALGSPNRMKILIVLLEGTKTFQELMSEVELGRTALANHLASLKTASLVDKIHHGYYRITETGIEFLQSINDAFLESQSIEIKEREAQQKKHLLDTFLQRRET
ncbi:MAG: winged helix-turn-helix transcriptional regulator [Candidatus Heimdallarchaeota archaeon]